MFLPTYSFPPLSNNNHTFFVSLLSYQFYYSTMNFIIFKEIKISIQKAPVHLAGAWSSQVFGEIHHLRCADIFPVVHHLDGFGVYSQYCEIRVLLGIEVRLVLVLP